MRRQLILIALFLLSQASARLATAQERDIETLFVDLRGMAEWISRAKPRDNVDAEVQQQAAKVVGLANSFQKVVVGQEDSRERNEALEDIATDIALLRATASRLANDKRLRDFDVDLVRDVTADLVVKNRYAEAHRQQPFMKIAKSVVGKRPDNLNELFASMKIDLTILRDDRPLLADLAEDGESRITKASANIDVLKAAAAEHQPGQDYVATLHLDSHWLTAAAQSHELPKELRAVRTGYAVADLATKAEHAKRNPKSPFDPVMTEVDTLEAKTKKSIPHYFVFYVANGLLREKRGYKRFKDLSTPTKRELVPGNWYFWASTRQSWPDGEAAGDGAVFDVKDDGSSEYKAPLLVPDGQP